METLIDVIWYLSYFLTVVGVVALINRLISYIKDKVLESKVNISGEYISEYEYVDGKETITRKAIAKFKQKGKRIKGTSYYHEKDQHFSFNAQLIDHTRVSGYYVSTNLQHKAYGNMFLEIQLNGVMQGSWVGYDGVQHSINGGLYAFYPILQDYTVIPMAKEHSQFIYDIAEYTLGKSRIPLSHFKQCWDENDSAFGLSVVYHDKKTDTKSIIGFLMGTLEKPQVLFEKMPISRADLPDAICLAEKVAWIDAIAVKREFQKKGIGTKLVQAFDEHAREQGVHVMLAFAQKHSQKTHLAGTLELLNYKKAFEADAFLCIKEECESMCLVCEVEPCECRSVIYYKVDESDFESIS